MTTEEIGGTIFEAYQERNTCNDLRQQEKAEAGDRDDNGQNEDNQLLDVDLDIEDNELLE